ncbi:MAG: RNA-protein complex protein Nop10 [Nitrososphaeraceae archaeon]|nr:RNA-protein complex protein Nop10 [Nitrososphaeraceae archaeon]
MVKSLLRTCIICGKYTLSNERCPFCGGELHSPHPAKFSLDDKYLRYKYRH